MASYEIPSINTISQAPVSKKETSPIILKERESNHRTDAFMHCRQVFWNDTENYPVQDIEVFFDFLKTQEKWTECCKFLSNCSDETLRKLIDPKEWFDGISNIAGINEILKQAVVSDKQAVVSDKQAVVSDKQAVFTEIRTKLQDKKKYGYLDQKNVEIIETNPNPLSSDFQKATKAILSEIKEHALKSNKPEDLAEYRSFLDNFHSIGAVSEVEYAILKREMTTLTEGLKKGNSDDAGKGYKLPEGFHESQNIKGVYTRYAPIGEKFDEVVTIQDGKGSKDIVSPQSGYSIHLGDAVNLEEYNFINQEANLRTKLGNITQTYTDILAKNDDFIAKEEKREVQTLKDMETLEKAKEFKKEKTEEFEREKQELEAKLAKLAQEKIEKRLTGGDGESREEQARETIQFVDDMGLYMLGVENVDRFFSIISTGSSNGKIDISNGLDNAEKAKIKQAFIELLGQDIFEPNPSCRLREGKTNEDIKKLLVEKKIYKEGEIPPVKLTDLKMAMTKNNA